MVDDLMSGLSLLGEIFSFCDTGFTSHPLYDGGENGLLQEFATGERTVEIMIVREGMLLTHGSIPICTDSLGIE